MKLGPTKIRVYRDTYNWVYHAWVDGGETTGAVDADNLDAAIAEACRQLDTDLTASDFIKASDQSAVWFETNPANLLNR